MRIFRVLLVVIVVSTVGPSQLVRAEESSLQGEPAQAPRSADPSPRPTWTRHLGPSLLVLGGTALVGYGVAAIKMDGRRDTSKQCRAEGESMVVRCPFYRTQGVGIAALTAGSLSVLTGTAWFIFNASESTQLAVGPGSLALRGRF